MHPHDLPPIVTPAQMRAIDERAIQGMGIPGLTLMENAGSGIAVRIIADYFEGEAAERRVAILCGPGNNGGDGMVIARYLHEAGSQVAVFLLGHVDALRGDARANADRVRALGLEIVSIDSARAIPDLDAYDLIVDAIFGTGFRGEITGLTAQLIEAANAAGAIIIAVDTPSGLDGETGALRVPAIRADRTYTLAALKRGQWLWPGRGHVGELSTIDIGIPPEVIDAEGIHLRLITNDFVREALPARPPDGHKGLFGKLLLVGGSTGMTGAVVLAASAALRTGLGLAYAAVPESLVDTVDAGSLETVARPLPEVRAKRVIARRALGAIMEMAASADALAIGPGLSTHHETQELVRRLVERRSRPMVLDADGLNACARDARCLEADSEVPLIITPHVGEMARLLNQDNGAVSADREGAAVAAARRFGCVVVMKGAPTFVADSEGRLYLNPTGNAGMATGGVGDVLTGIIGSLLAQGVEPLSAALAGVYIHGLAGDVGAYEFGQRALMASDLVNAIPDALLALDL